MKALFFFCIVTLWPISYRRIKVHNRVFLLLSELCYIGGVLYYTLLSRSTMEVRHAQLHIFWSYKSLFLSVESLLRNIASGDSIQVLHWDVFETVILNVLMMVPAGYLFVPILRKPTLFKTVVLCLCASLVIEIVQYYTKLGWFEIDDLISNTFGGVIGYEYYKHLGRS